MAFHFSKVEDVEAISLLAGMAGEIWHEYFPSILSTAQIDYMVEKFQSVGALTDQIKNRGYEYYFIEKDGQRVGYTGIRAEKDKLFLSKLYLLKAFRGKGYASRAFDFLSEQCRRKGLRAIWLTVNRGNDHSIAVYRKKGFEIIRLQKADIGEGFVMDDYIMEKTL